MNLKLKNPINPNYDVATQILTNRGIDENDIQHYLYPTDSDLYAPELLGEDKLKAAVEFIDDTINNQHKTMVVIDCDADGFCSSAILINYLTDLNKDFAANKIKWYLHDDKTHGLKDCFQFAIEHNYTRIFVPDAASNDDEYFKELERNNIKVLVMDHHLIEGEVYKSDNVIIINNQLCDYPNKELCGGGVTYKVLKYYDKVKGYKFADHYLDLVALANISDMMSMRSIETHYLAELGILKENLHNPFFYGMVEHNKFKLGDTLSPIKVAFYVTPFINAMCRSGTLEEKDLLFQSMIKIHAFDKVISTGRDDKGKETDRVTEAIRTAVRVKNRQTKEQDDAVERLEKKIKDEDLLKNKVLLLLVKPEDNINPNVRGLIANKLMAKYQRPCAILTITKDENGNNIYAGSMRGYTGTGIEDFKKVCEEADVGATCIGHQNAAGLVFAADKVQDFINNTNEILKNVSSEIIISCDYIFDNSTIDENILMDIGYLNTIWGQDIPEPLIGLKNVKIYPDNIMVMKDKHLKLMIGGVPCIKFFATDLIEQLQTEDGCVTIDAYGKANLNEWGGRQSGQILLDEVEIVDKEEYLF